MIFPQGDSAPLREAQIIGVYGAITVTSAIVVTTLGIPEQFLMAFALPVLLAAQRPGRIMYGMMFVIFIICTVVATENYYFILSDSMLTLVALFLTLAVASEAISFSARRQAQLAIRVAESEQRLRAFLENAPDSIFVVDQPGYITEVNDAACRTFGYERDELIGALFDTLCIDEYPVRFGVDLGPKWSGQLRRADGTTFAVEMTMEKFVLQRATSCVAIVRDVEERTRAEAKLRQAEAIRASILDSIPDYLMMLDLDYRFLFLNKTPPDRSVEAVLGGVIFDFLVSAQREKLLACFDRVRETQQIESLETEYVQSDTGQVIHFENRVVPVIEDGEVTKFIVSSSDVTERWKREAERVEFERSMLRSQKLESLGLLAGGIAHDFNNLLVAIMGRADLARVDAGNRELTEGHLQQILEASQHAAELCQQLLAYSGKGRFLVAPMDLASLISETQTLMEISVPDNIVMTYSLEATPNAVEVDVTQIRQVMMNLVTNAFEALQPGGGRICIKTGVETLDQSDLRTYANGDCVDEGTYAYLAVEDSGSGMTAETLERLFDPFYTTKPDGTGLGMAAVLGIVRSHDGAMSVTTQEGAGTTVRVLLPTTDTPAPKAIDAAQPTACEHRGGGLILVVDDESAVRAVTQRMLEFAEFDVVTAASGTEAIKVLKAHKDAVIAVVLDMKMPDMNGEQAMKKLRAVRPDLPVLFSSGYSEVEITKRLEGKGVAAFLPKPYRSADLLNALNGMLSPSY